MISKLRFSLIAVILLVLLGFGFQNQANGQAGENAQFCPFVEVSDGWLDVEDITPLLPAPNFTAGLIGTIEGVNGTVVGGMDWMHVDSTSFDQPTPTNQDGSQIVTWWTQKNGRTTYVQLTNDAPFSTWVHARLLDEDCVEIRNFCDFYTGGDTHVYDFSDLITNNGDTPDDQVLQGHEGFLTITAVDDCPSPDQAIEHNALVATVQVQSNIDEYGFNAYHRHGVCFDEEVFTDVNLILNGSFQDGNLGPWNLAQGNSANAGVITSSGISPSIAVPPCQGPDCGGDADLFMAFVASDDSFRSGFYGEGFPGNTILGSLADNNLIGGAIETNVTVIQSNQFTPLDQPDADSNTNIVEYDLRFLAANDVNFDCDNFVAVCLINVTQFNIDPDNNDPVFTDCDCYNRTGDGSFDDNFGCNEVGDDNFSYTIGTHEFQGGSSALISGTLSTASDFQDYVVQVITAQKTNNGCRNANFPRGDTGTLVDNFRNIETLLTFEVCDGTLTGDFNAFLSNHNPERFAGQFNVIEGDTAGGDAVVINFADEYLPEYRTLGAFVSAEVGIFDDVEDFQSCGDVEVCFVRLGIDANIPISEEFDTPTPSGQPSTPPPSITPTVPPTTPPPSNNGNGGSCAIAASPAHLGTAFANVLIPLVPVAFAFGVRAVRRRKK